MSWMIAIVGVTLVVTLWVKQNDKESDDQLTKATKKYFKNS